MSQVANANDHIYFGDTCPLKNTISTQNHLQSKIVVISLIAFFFFLDFSCLPVVKKWRDTVDECIAVCECIFLMQKSFALIRKQGKVNSTVIAQDSPNYTSYVQIGLKLFSL